MKKTLFTRKIPALLLMLLVGSISSAVAQSTLTPGSAINVAGKQRFLSQRMGKDYIFRVLGKQVELATKEMQVSMILFDENLKALKAYVPKSAAALLTKEETLWLDYRKLLATEPTKEGAQAVLNANSQLLAATNDVVVDLVKWAATQPRRESEQSVAADLVAENANQAGRMRMLSQRLTFYYGAYVAGLTAPNNDLVKQLQQVATGIQGGMNSLVTSDVNTVDIDDAISNAIIDWRVIEEKCSKNNCISFEDKSMDPGEVFLVTNRMLIKMDKITGMYAKLLE
jgi:Type IV pili methyl-accepting chemotaxis transducer N-term